MNRARLLPCLVVISFFAFLFNGCSGGSKPIALTLNFSGTQLIDNGQSLAITVTGAGSKGVMWSLASAGTLSNATTTSVTYNAPAGPLTAPVTDHLTATSLDDSTKTVMLAITNNPSPSITTTQAQLTSAPATVGNAYTFTFAATGGSGALNWSATGLPSWLSISAAGILSGTPPAGSAGTFNFTVTVTDSSAGGAKSTTSGQLTLTVNQAAAITSANNVTFVVGTAGTFTVTTTGKPTPTLSETGTLPTGVTFNPATGVLSGTPATGTAAAYPIVFTAHNGIGADAVQNFTLTVGQPPAITSANSTTFTAGTTGTFTVAATGFPAPTFSETGALPTGVTFNTTTGVLSGTPAAGTGKTYPIMFTASNGVGSNATQSFTLTVDETPAISSANKTTFTVGTAGTFTVTATGFPKPSLAETGALPTGVTFVDNGNGTGTLAGVPAPGTAANYSITFTPSNGIGSPAGQSFTLTVGQPPAITSANSTTFTVGTAGTFTVTATGFPAPTFSETGALPTGVTFNTTTGVLSGTPAAGTGKTYSIMFTASNGVGTNATQTFTLTVDEAPGISSANNTTFTVGAAGTFTVTTTGFPASALSESGALPTGVTFTDNGNGTGKLSGTPTAAGAFPITFTATNGVGSPANQSFTLTVNTAPIITSANATTFTVGTAGTFTVTATGTPTPTLSETGTLPAGVTFNPGTGVLSGTPAVGTGKTYSITFTASNGVGSNATQNFTLTVDEAPAITSPNATTFTVGVSGSFTVMTTGFPKPSLIEAGALPSGVTFADNGNGTGTLSGTPASGSLGTYTITFTATNSVGSPATQSFTLTVSTAPVITSAPSTTFTVGTPGTFTVTTTGTPTPTVSETGTLPSGVTFTGGSGTGTLGGTPAAGTGGIYSITIKATSSSGTTSQSFTLTVDEAPKITSANSTTFTVGANGSFTVTTTAFPPDPITETGALPSGVTFVDNGNNTATLSGTPGPGTAGNYPIVITASNGVAPNATQNFTLTVSASGVACGPGGHETVFKGQYAFLFQGFDASGPVAIGGIFSADGTGKIALLAGLEDINRGTGVQTSVSILSATSSYSVSQSNNGFRGCLTLATSSGTSQYAFSLGSLNGSNVATKGRMIEVDNSGTLGSGVLRLQDSAAFSTTAVSASGNFAFGATSTLTLSTSTSGANRFVVIGSANVSNPNSITGEEDFNLSGNVDGGSTTGAAARITGGSLNVSANGRGTLSLIVAAIGGFPGSTFNTNIYVVSATEFLFMNIGAQTATNPLFAGSALKQSSGFSLSSLNANMVLYATGICSTCGSGGTPGPQLTIGVITIPSAGNFSFTADQNSGGVLTSPFTFVGTYTVDASGRVLISKTGTTPGLAMYIVSSNQGFFGSTGTDVNFGFAEPQTGGPSFTNASLSGALSFGTTEKVTQNVSDNSGVANFDGIGTIAGTSDMASLGSTPNTNTFSQPYSVTNGMGTPGRGTIMNSSGTNVNLIFYIISPSKVVLMDVNSGGGGTANPNPALLIGEK